LAYLVTTLVLTSVSCCSLEGEEAMDSPSNLHIMASGHLASVTCPEAFLLTRGSTAWAASEVPPSLPPPPLTL